MVEPLDGGLVETSNATEIQLRQLGSTLKIAVEDAATEDARGVLRKSHMALHSPSMDMTVDVAVDGATATVKQTTGKAESARTVHLDHDMVGPEGLRRRTLAELKAPGDHIDFYTWSDEQSAPTSGHRVVEAIESVDVDGVATKAMRVKTSLDGGSAAVVAWLDADGEPLRSEEVVSFGKIATLRTKGEPAPLAEAPATDTIDATMIRSNARLPDARSLDRLVVRVAPLDPAYPLPPLDGPGQRVVSSDARGSVVEISRVAPPVAGAAAQSHAGDADDAALLGVSGPIDPTDAKVRSVAAEATAGETDPWAKAQKLVHWVAAKMTYDPKVPVAPAATIVNDLHGSCYSYATLLASLLRASGIPARGVTGVVYVGGIFGGHAWVEAKIGGDWRPLDATIGNLGTADAARLALAHDSTSPGGSVAQSKFLGHAKLAVLEYQPHGKPAVKVDPNGAPYVVKGQTYRNAGLGVSLTLPKGGEYKDLDAVFPNPSFVTAKVGGDVVVLQEADVPPVVDFDKMEAAILRIPSLQACKPMVVSGEHGCRVPTEGGEMVAFHRGSSLIVVGAIGPTGSATLSTVGKSLELARK
jgi:transglutaminase-like putative cysteine protease